MCGRTNRSEATSSSCNGPRSWAATAMVSARARHRNEGAAIMKSFGKKILTTLMLAGVTFGFAGRMEAQPIRVITTTPELADMTKQIGRELVDAESLTRGVEFMHAVPVKPSFVPKLNRANLLAHMGLDLEVSWLPALL